MILDRIRWDATPFLITAFVAAIYWFTFGGRLGNLDEVAVLAVTESLVKRGAVDANSILWLNSPMAWGSIVHQGVDGNYYSIKGVSTALLAAPFYWLGLWSGAFGLAPFALITNVVLSACVAGAAMLCVQTLGFRIQTAVLAALATAFSTMMWPYSKTLLTEPANALGFIIAMWGVSTNARTTSAPALLVAGLGLGLAVASAYIHLIALPLFFLFVILGQSSRRLSRMEWRARLYRTLFLLLGFIPFGLGVAYYNTIRFSGPFNTGHNLAALGLGFQVDTLLGGLYGLTLSPYRGLLFFFPPFVILPLGLRLLSKNHGRNGEAVLIGALVTVELLLYSSWTVWWGGFTLGPRYLLPLMPLMIVGLAPILDLLFVPKRSRLIYLVVGLFAFSVAMQALFATSDYSQYEDQVSSRLNFQLLNARALTDVVQAIRLDYWTPLGLIETIHPFPFNLAWLDSSGIHAASFLTAALAVLISGVGLGVGVRAKATAGRAIAWWWPALSVLAIAIAFTVGLHDYASRVRASNAMPVEPLLFIEERASNGDAVIFVAPEKRFDFLNVYHSRLPIYGLSRDSTALSPVNASGLMLAFQTHSRVWVLFDGIPPADPLNPAERWLAQNAYPAEDHWIGSIRVGLFGRGMSLDAACTLPTKWVNGIALVGCRYPSVIDSHVGVIPLDLDMIAEAQVNGNYSVFVHLDADGSLVAQHDSIPGAGYFPTYTWRTNVPVAVKFGVALPANLPAGEYKIALGMVDLATGHRVPINRYADGVSMDDDRVNIGSIKITAP